MNEQDKLRVLIPHWIEHNQEHAGEFRKWATRTNVGGDEIVAAADLMLKVNQSLALALEKLGGPLEHHQPGLDGDRIE